jgi:hypothetical protein
LFPAILGSHNPRNDGTEYSFVGFWDSCIRIPLETLIPDGETVRNSNKGTSTLNDRPDYALILSNACPFRGEEKASISTEDPKLELGKKLLWTYDPAPYVLGKTSYLFQDVLHTNMIFAITAGYYAHGLQVTLTAICQPSEKYATPDVVDIVQSNLKFRRERVRHLLRMINLSCIINSLQPVIGRSGIPELKPIYR